MIHVANTRYILNLVMLELFSLEFRNVIGFELQHLTIGLQN